jgi:hypothetical protein
MRSNETTKLPSPNPQYDYQNEMITRRTIEQTVTDLRADIVDLRDSNDSTSTLARRRHQFLLMGA